VCMCVFVYVFRCQTPMCTHARAHTRKAVHFICLRIFKKFHVYEYIFTYLYVCMYIYIYTHTLCILILFLTRIRRWLSGKPPGQRPDGHSSDKKGFFGELAWGIQRWNIHMFKKTFAYVYLHMCVYL